MYVKERIFLIIFFAILSLALLSPLASNIYIPNGDHSVHTAIIMQAKMAIREGQFPIRVASWEHEGWGNAFFQFYSPFPVMIGGLLYKIALSFDCSNPYIIFKSMMWLSLFLGGLFSFQLASWLSGSRYAAVLCAVVYVTAPYFLINIHVRGALPEAFAQGLLPFVILVTLKGYMETLDLKQFILIVISWFLLLTTHLVTFVYSSFFVGLLLILLAIISRDRNALKKIVLLGLTYFFACLLAAWYLVPIALLTKYFMVATRISSPFFSNWLTPLSALLSSVAVSPTPLPGNNGLIDLPLYSGLGWPILTSAGIVCYLVMQKRLTHNRPYQILILPLLCLFFLAFFMIWSPWNFWDFLPHFLAIAQFPYRLLTQTMWIGIFLFSCVLLEVFKENLNFNFMIFGVFVIVVANSSWLPTLKGALQAQAIIDRPSLGYPADDYLVNPKVLSSHHLKDKSELSVETLKPFCIRKKGKITCDLQSSTTTQLLQLPVLYYPRLLEIKVNEEKVNYIPTLYKNLVLVGIQAKPNIHYHITAQFVGIRWANWLSLGAWLILLLASLFYLFNKVLLNANIKQNINKL